MRWLIGGEPTFVPTEDKKHQLIAYGIGHLHNIPSDGERELPVHLDEPLVVLFLRSFFEKSPDIRDTSIKDWIRGSLRVARDQAARGLILEEIAMMVFIEKFGGKFTVLGDVFHFGKPSLLASREVTLVSLMRIDDKMHACSVSWAEGSSTKFGFKAKTPLDVLRFLENPDGTPFLFPDNHMHPDLAFFFRDKESGEIIVVFAQSKAAKILNAQTWMEALDSVTPAFFYTQMVCFRFMMLTSLDSPFYQFRKMDKEVSMLQKNIHPFGKM